MQKTRRMCWAVVWFLGLLARLISAQAVVPFGFVDEPVVTTGLSFPVDLCWLNTVGEQRLIVLEKGGEIKLVVNGVMQGMFMDLSGKVSSYIDRGLMSCLVDVDLKGSYPYVYFAYVVQNPGVQPQAQAPGRISKFTVAGDLSSALLASEKVLIGTVSPTNCGSEDFSQDMICCTGPMHCLGGMQMMPNGIIFAGSGDGCRPNEPSLFTMQTQNINSLMGKILRMTRSGRGLTSNPFYEPGMPLTANKSKIWSLGVRNPFRMTLDPGREIPYVVDVGWSSFEEINWAARGVNLGWPCKQALIENVAFAGYDDCVNYPVDGADTDPLEFYGRSEGHCVAAVVPVDFASWPGQYRKKVFYIDYVFNWIKTFEVDPITYAKIPGSNAEFAQGLNRAVTLVASPNDELWYINIESRELRRIRYDPDPSRPRVSRVVPPPDSSGIEVTADIVVSFSKPVKPSSLNNTNLRLFVFGDTSDQVGFDVTYDAATWSARIRPRADLRPFTTYRMRVQNLEDPLGVTMSGRHDSNFSTGDGRTEYLSDLPFLIQLNGLGPVSRDLAPAEFPERDPRPIRVRGEIFEKGLGVAAVSHVRVRVPEGCSEFQAIVALEDGGGNLDTGKLFFRVQSSTGANIFNSRPTYPEGMKRVTPGLPVSVNVQGLSYISLWTEDDGYNRIMQNWGCWADARFRCGNFDGAGPAVVEITPLNGSTGVSVENPGISLTFSEPLSPAYILSGIEVSSNEQAIGWEPIVNSDATIVQVLVVGRLEYDSTFTVKATRQLRDLVGNRLESQVSSSFSTKSAPVVAVSMQLDKLTPYAVQGYGEGLKRGRAPIQLADTGNVIKSYYKGLVMSAPSRIDYNVPQSCWRVLGSAGMDLSMVVHESVSASYPDGCNMSIIYPDTNEIVWSGRTTRTQLFWFNKHVVPGRVIRVISNPHNPAANPAICDFAQLRFKCNQGQSIRHFSGLSAVSRQGSISFDKDFNLQPMRYARRGVLAFGGGFEMKAWTRFSLNIPPNCSRFYATAGIDAREGRPEASLQFKMVQNNYNGPCQTSVMRVGDPTEEMNCSVQGSTELRFVLGVGGDSDKHDFGSLGNARVECLMPYSPPRCRIDTLTDNFRVGQEIVFAGVGLDSVGAEISPSKISWRIVQHHCSIETCHTHEVNVINGVPGGSFIVDDHGDEFRYEVICSVCDDSVCTVSSQLSYPQTADVTVDTAPTGLLVGVDSGNGIGPITRRIVVGARITISVGEEQSGQRFNSWQHNSKLGPVFSYLVQNSSSVRFVATFT